MSAGWRPSVGIVVIAGSTAALLMGTLVARTPRAGQAGVAAVPQPQVTPAPPHPTGLSADDLFARSSPAVVRVVVRDANQKVTGLGSGFFVSPDGLLVTNFHVIRNADSASVLRSDNGTFTVEGVVAVDPKIDLAILKVDARRLACLAVASDVPPRVGAKVYAIGNPEGLTNTLSEGLISGVRRWEDNGSDLQTTAPISPGSSGGPLLNATGEVVGVTTCQLRDGQNLNFAVPAQQVRKLLNHTGPLQTLAVAGATSAGVTGAPAIAGAGALDEVWTAIAAARYDEASARLASLREKLHDNPAYWFASGRLHYLLRNWALAAESFRTATRLKPDFAEAFVALGWCDLELKKPDEAMEVFKTASKVKPSFAPAYVGAGTTCNYQGNFSKALTFFNWAVKLDPNDALAHWSMGLAYGGLGQNRHAIAAYQKAIAIRPDYAAAYLNLGRLLHEEGEDNAARVAYQNAIRFDPEGHSGFCARNYMHELR